jgi:hypothetical protein
MGGLELRLVIPEDRPSVLHISLELKMKRYGASPSSVTVDISSLLLVQLGEHDFL